MGNSEDQKIIQSWNDNATLWTAVVRTQALESRRLVTNDAVLNTVLSCGGSRILDVGCGEGWLAHALMRNGKEVTGLDVSPNLIEQARKESAAKFHVISYEKFAADPHVLGNDFDVIVCNFSLFSNGLKEILKVMLSITRPSGHLVIQTLHPYSSVGELRYEDGWREEHFNELPGTWSSMPWYFRTISSWIRELTCAGWSLDELKEPLHPVTGKPASLILVGTNSLTR
jgi:2-polyprenyl-3-methyl-5-hydroxy-6-metoxy-1,4-benzoquinol methylase